MLEENNFSNPLTEDLTPQQPEAVAQESPYSEIIDKYREKKEIRKLAMAVGFPTLFLLAVGFAFTFAFIIVAIFVFKMSYNDAVTLMNDPALLQVFQIVLSCLMFLLPFTVAVKCIGRRVDRTIDFGLPKKGTAIPFLLFGIGFCSFSNIASTYSSGLFEGIGIEYSVPDNELPSGIFGFLLTFIATAIVPALVEEFACRGIVLGLLKKHGEAFAIITSSIVFGVMHGNFEQMPFATLVGLVLGYIYVKTGSIWIGVVVHFANNAVSVIFAYLEMSLPSNMMNLLYVLYLTTALLAAIVGILLFTKGEENFGLQKAEGPNTDKQRYVWFFTSWVIIIFIALNLLESLMFFDFSGIIKGIAKLVGL